MEAQTICNAFFNVFFFQIRLDDSKSPIAPGYNFRYGISIHIYQDIILLMIEVVIRKKYWSSIQVILSWDGNVYIILLLLKFFFSDLPNTMLRIMFSTEHC